MKPLLIVGGVIVGIAILVVLAGVLYVWANSLVEDELEGTWYAENNNWIKFNSDHTFDCNSQCDYDEWKMSDDSGEIGFCVDRAAYGCDDSMYQVYKYEVKGDVLFLAPVEPDGTSGDCLISVRAENPASYEGEASSESPPYWCDA
jgi:hypothetical protein